MFVFIARYDSRIGTTIFEEAEKMPNERPNDMRLFTAA